MTLPLPRQVDEQIHACYTQTMAEWLGCEAIVRQRERESHAAALAKCSSGASLDSHLHRMMHRDSTISNEVMGGTHPGARGAVKAGICAVYCRNGDSWVSGAVTPSVCQTMEFDRPVFESSLTIS